MKSTLPRDTKHLTDPDNIAMVERLAECAESFGNDDPAQPTYNAHVCKKCGHAAFSVHVHTGVASARITCTEPGCGGEAWSAFYRVTAEIIPEGGPAWEWYRPTLKEMQGAPGSRDYLNHVLNSGLLLRERTGLPMLRHDGGFVDSGGDEVESPTEIEGLKELGALQKVKREGDGEQRIITHGARQEFERLKRRDKSQKRKKRQQARASKRRNKKR